jgi:hypothetical protein
MIGLHEGAGVRASRPAGRERVLTLHATVVGCSPRIWRRLAVRETLWLSRLHDCLQVAFDWYDYQTHSFEFDGLRYGNPLSREGLTIEDDRDVTLREVGVPDRARFAYRYHFGEGWLVEVALEKVSARVKGERLPRCLAGERAGPPEDCGGVDAYHEMVAALQVPYTDESREWREWLGSDYDPEACSLDRINRAFRSLGR